jgi:mRNA interferase HigB
MRVITRKRLVEFGGVHPDARQPLAEWYLLTSKGRFSGFNELKQTFGSADHVGKFTVFDIGGNKYRLIAAVHYNRGIVYIRHVLTHAEYDLGKWKEK